MKNTKKLRNELAKLSHAHAHGLMSTSSFDRECNKIEIAMVKATTKTFKKSKALPEPKKPKKEKK